MRISEATAAAWGPSPLGRSPRRHGGREPDATARRGRPRNRFQRNAGGDQEPLAAPALDGSEGENIRLVREERGIPRYVSSTAKPAVAQLYLPPMLHEGGRKFDLRLYCVVVSCDPLEAYLHGEGLARFCAEEYFPPTDDNLQNTFAHLTNYSINKKSRDFLLIE